MAKCCAAKGCSSRWCGPVTPPDRRRHPGTRQRAESPPTARPPRGMIADIDAWTPQVGCDLACCAFGVAPRAWRHHRQERDGRLVVRPSRATGQPPHDRPAKLSPIEHAAVLGIDDASDLARPGPGEDTVRSAPRRDVRRPREYGSWVHWSLGRTCVGSS